MRRFRFNIASLLVVVLLVAVGFAALRESNETWDSGLFTLTLSVLLASTLLAIHRNDARRAFWIGFAVFGGGYLVLSLVPSIESRLATTQGARLLGLQGARANPDLLQGPVHRDWLGSPWQPGPGGRV